MEPTATAPERADAPASAETPAATQNEHAPRHFLSREELLSNNRPQIIRDVEFPGWGVLRVGELRQRQKEQVDFLATKREGDKTITDYRLYIPGLVAAALRNPDGSPMFTDWEKVRGELADRLTPAQMQKLFEVAAEINALSREAREALGKASSSTQVAATSLS